jgi:tetratricopeptide (TPR) repeat protein
LLQLCPPDYTGLVMKFRHATLSLLTLAALLAGIFLVAHEFSPSGEQGSLEAEGPVPIPPIPPRIAEGTDYDKCLGMLTTDPPGAANFAEAWEATGGGDPATHCRGLAEIALGEPERGGDMLEKLAARSQGPALARATLYAQAAQAWMVAEDASHAFTDDSLALALAPGTPDTLLDRALAALLLDRNQDAIDDTTAALDIDPRRPDAYVLRGTAWRRVERWELARDDIDRALMLDPDVPDALLERGILRQHARDLRGARADWQRVMELAPNTPIADLAQQNLDLLEAGPPR